ncbi:MULTISPECIES: alpha/beta hydrolase [unclassified Cryobacterium]|uniref:alpha/beta hydrolase n=1 Tax=unclassified Cryobacterium TaxID=2649013 RepID=UPI00106A7118|nr:MULTISPECIES: alpha/beta hydrolase [unclassified Cryobacterium]TFB94784.1 alpha/beta hydrolase [Cryobacterium sp. MDB2-A-1]TFC02275.1 alpha/beta hydrolase [Cryobacterium sp. MDB2-33-2]TFC16144.1 alpha/beta hydrolase [Cryobacterium sp. MDB2-A-2]TFC22170.1 alpha/beta hydrolase [Cryobacterium sp. MDB2-10]
MSDTRRIRSAVEPTAGRADMAFFWAGRVVATLGVIVTAWAALSTGSMLVHGHPAYLVLLVLTFAVSLTVALRSWLTRTVRHRGRTGIRGVLVALSLGVIALAWWLVPSSAVEPALSAMDSDTSVTVTETADQIVLQPTGAVSEVGVFFQPGARVDARAYAAVLRPLAAAGHVVVIPKQPFGIAFLSTGAFGSARAAHPPVERWVVGGHSLGGTVAAMDAQSFAGASTDPVVGLLFFASYPANDLSALGAGVLSISGTNDGLATPDKISASKASLPADARYLVIEGGVHAFFGDYGPQSGDGEQSISQDAARAEISAASVDFVNAFDH